MSQNGQAKPQARILDLVTREVADEVLVCDLKRHKAHCLNQTAALVWKHCDGRKGVTEIAKLIEQDVNTTVDEATIWDQLSKANLLEQCIASPAGIPRMSRRLAMRKIGLGAALALPLVISVVAPTSESHRAGRRAALSITIGNISCCSDSFKCRNLRDCV